MRVLMLLLLLACEEKTTGLPPTVAFETQDGSTVLTNSTQSMSAVATNAKTVRFFVNNVQICAATKAPYTCQYRTPNVPGAISLKAVAENGALTATAYINLTAQASAPPPVTSTPDATPPAGYYLHFRDEFDTPGAPNPLFWDYDVDYVRNSEVQCYTENRRENVRVENGNLILELRKEPWSCPQDGNKTYQYTSGSIKTRKKGWGPYLVNMTHGRYEIRAKIPPGRGTWPALWLKGDGPLGSWPKSGEIDILEAVGYEEARGKYVLHSALHRPAHFGWPNGWGTTGQGMDYFLNEPPSANYHVWTLDWNPDYIEIFIDGVRVTKMLVDSDRYEDRMGFFRGDFNAGNTAEGWPFSKQVAGSQFELILNLAWGGNWGGNEGLDDSLFTNGNRVEFLIDYVRVYRKN